MSEVAAFGGAPFSSTVDLWLEAGDVRIPLTHVAPGYVRTQWGIELPPGPAVVVVSVDGHAFRTPVTLDYGVQPGESKIITRPHDAIPF